MEGVILFLDVETTKKPLFKPWQEGAKLCLVGLRVNGTDYLWTFNHDEFTGEKTYQESIGEIQGLICQSNTIVGHNLKFDMLWLKSLGIETDGVRLYCTQVAEYLIDGQAHTKDRGYYTLEETSVRRGGERKIDKIKLEYWDRGIDTPQIPLNILQDYLRQDLFITEGVYTSQLSQLPAPLKPHLSLAFEEMRALVDIEMEGMRVREDILLEQYERYGEDLSRIDGRLCSIVGKSFNFDSGSQLSCVLFGGTYTVGAREWFYREYKSGRKLCSRNTTLKKAFKGLGFTPDPTTEYKDSPGTYSVDKDVLSQLTCKTKEQREFLKLLQERNKISTQLSLIKNKKGGLTTLLHNGIVHTNYNQTVTATTRLSSSEPNLQNLPREGTAPVKLAFVSQYDH